MPELGNALNRVFADRLHEDGFRKEAEERAQAFLKLSIYEGSILSRIIPPKEISPAQCDRDPNEPILLRKVIDKEFTDVNAVAMDFRGKGDHKYVDTAAYTVDFYKIMSEEYSISEGELRAKEQPIQELIRHHTARRIEDVMDTAFLSALDKAVTSTGQVETVTDDILLPSNIKKIRNVLDGQTTRDKLEAATLLMTRSRFNDIDTWQQTGVDNGMGQEYWVDGFKYDRLFRLRVVKTIKNDLLPDNHIYVFTSPEFLGHHLTFNDDRFQIKLDYDVIKWKGWKTHGATIGNERAVARLELAT